MTAWLFRILFRMAFRFDLLPCCREYGTGRGGSIARYYIDAFIQQYHQQVKGRVLEFYERRYQHFFDGSQIKSYDVFDITKRKETTIQGDIQHCPQVKSESFDAIICTQVLQYVFSPEKALDELYRLLIPKGVLLLTVPCSGHMDQIPVDHWRFTPDSWRTLLSKYSFEELVIEERGNIYATSMYALGLGTSDTNEKILAKKDDRNPLELTAFARKAQTTPWDRSSQKGDPNLQKLG